VSAASGQIGIVYREAGKFAQSARWTQAALDLVTPRVANSIASKASSKDSASQGSSKASKGKSAAVPERKSRKSDEEEELDLGQPDSEPAASAAATSDADDNDDGGDGDPALVSLLKASNGSGARSEDVGRTAPLRAQLSRWIGLASGGRSADSDSEAAQELDEARMVS
jgi:hypothetical protein